MIKKKIKEKPLNRYFTTSSFEKELKLNKSLHDQLGEITNEINELKQNKNKLIDRLIEIYESNASRKKELIYKSKLENHEILLYMKLKEKEEILKKIIKTI
jgi:hypothetical protein